MGELIDLAERRASRAKARQSVRPAFYFDLADPFSYLAAERIERVLGEVDWIPTAGGLLRVDGDWAQPASVRAHAETCAVALKLPLVWPDSFPAETPKAQRAATYAAEIGAGCRFALAASRLAFCGGFDLEDPVTLAEASAAAGIGLRDVLSAAGEPDRDEALQASALGLLSHGVRRLPAVRIGSRWFHGDGVLAAASAYLRSGAWVGAPAADRRLGQ
jgi:2-hydroxychromene-2-carboxylate isomerase